MKFGLMFFASSEESLSGSKYRLVLESARFADENGLSSVWVPERHFTEFGSLYPNPAVLHSALAVATNRIRLNAGSVVAPLHQPIRIAEEWSMVDNLSNGRIGISFAPGWNPDDFAICPEKYATRQDEMLASIATVRHLWRGGTVDAVSGNGNPIQLRVYPTPVQRELPVWLTAAGNPKTFTRAGEIGANLLTHLLDQDEDQLARKIALYREARAKSGFDPALATVTVMLHTFVGSDPGRVREQARVPFCSYIRNNIGLLNGLAQSRGQQVNVRSMPPRELDEFVQFLYERFAHSRGLIGTPETCLPLIERLQAIGVDEVACLLDFGPPVDLILESLPHLRRLRDLAHSEPRTTALAFNPALIQQRCAEQISGIEFNQEIKGYGVQIQDEFQGIQQIWRRTGEALAKISFPAGACSSKFELHPAFLDSCSRVIAAAIDRDSAGADSFFLPSGVGKLRVHRRPSGTQIWSHATLRMADSPDDVAGDVRIYDASGLLIEIESLLLRRMGNHEQSQDFGALLYRRAWKPLPLQINNNTVESGEWLILSDRSGVGARLAALLQDAGNTCAVLFADSLTTGSQIAERPWKGVIHLQSLDLAPLDVEGRARISASVLECVKALAPGNGVLPHSKLWLVTSGAIPVFENENCAVAHSPLWGLGQAVAIEEPAIWGGLIDLDPNDPSERAIFHSIQSSQRERMLAVRNGETYVARIERDGRQPPLTERARFHKDATYLITGGLGGLGGRLTSWLLERGAGHVVLLGRSGAQTSQARNVRVFQCDVSRGEKVVEVVAEIARSMPPLKGVFHLAGALDDASLLDQDAGRFHRAGAAKIDGAWNLHQATADASLDYFVMFSSMASLVTMPGQGNYAAANIFLDALAHQRRAQGKPALSVNWGPWAEIGHAATEYGRRAHERLASLGIDPLPPDVALGALRFLLERRVTQAGVARMDWARLSKADPGASGSPLLADLLQLTENPHERETELVLTLKSCVPEERHSSVAVALATIVADVLRLPDANAIGHDQSLFDLGLDSILALELTSRVSSSFGRPFRGTLFFTHPTLGALADYILGELSLGEEFGEAAEEELSALIAQEIGQR